MLKTCGVELNRPSQSFLYACVAQLGKSTGLKNQVSSVQFGPQAPSVTDTKNPKCMPNFGSDCL